MGKLFQRYKDMSFERKTILKTAVALCCSATLACGKFLLGLFSDFNLCITAIYAIALLLAKLQCVLGAKAGAEEFKKRNALVAVFLMISSVIYIAFMCAALFFPRNKRRYGLGYVVMLAFISFCELGFAIAGIFRTKNRGHFYRDIKIINFCVALIALLTTQTTILDFMSAKADIYNEATGICIGVFIALCAVFISLAPKLSVVGREHNVFTLEEKVKNKIVNKGAFEIVLCRSAVYGSYVYRAVFSNGRVEGDIGRTPSLWKRMNIFLKIICCILAEILVFFWLSGRAVLFFRSANLPVRLEKIMNENGFVKCESVTSVPLTS